MERSIYTPGAGFMPPLLAGRDAQQERWAVMLNDVQAVGRVRAVDTVLVGPRGVGKTALLSRMEQQAERAGYDVVSVQAIRDHGGLLESVLQMAHERAGDGSGPWARVRDALGRISSVSVGVAGMSAGVATAPQEKTPFDPHRVASVLAQLARDIRAERARGGLMLSIDEVQVMPAGDLALLAATLHQLNRPRLVDAPVAFAGAGLPNTLETMNTAGVTHPDRLFRFDRFPLRLTPEQTEQAVVVPANEHGVTWHPDAVAQLVKATQGYPAHVQLLADAAWQQSAGPMITAQDFNQASGPAVEQIALQTLEPQWEGLPAREKEYVAALSVLGGRASSKEVADVLGVRPSDRSLIRDQLINERGIVFVPAPRQVELSMPLMSRFAPHAWDHDRDEQDHPEHFRSVHDMRMTAIQARLAHPTTPATTRTQRELPPLPPEQQGIDGPSLS